VSFVICFTSDKLPFCMLSSDTLTTPHAPQTLAVNKITGDLDHNKTKKKVMKIELDVNLRFGWKWSTYYPNSANLVLLWILHFLHLLNFCFCFDVCFYELMIKYLVRIWLLLLLEPPKLF